MGRSRVRCAGSVLLAQQRAACVCERPLTLYLSTNPRSMGFPEKQSFRLDGRPVWGPSLPAQREYALDAEFPFGENTSFLVRSARRLGLDKTL